VAIESSLNEAQQRRLLSNAQYADKLLSDIEAILTASESKSIFPKFRPDVSPLQVKLIGNYVGSLATAGAAETLAYLPQCDLGVVLISAGSTLNDEDLSTIRLLYEAANALLTVWTGAAANGTEPGAAVAAAFAKTAGTATRVHTHLTEIARSLAGALQRTAAALEQPLAEAFSTHGRLVENWSRRALAKLQLTFDSSADAYRAQLARLIAQGAATTEDQQAVVNDLARLNEVGGDDDNSGLAMAGVSATIEKQRGNSE
jgi:hypothetical protein